MAGDQIWQRRDEGFGRNQTQAICTHDSNYDEFETFILCGHWDEWDTFEQSYENPSTGSLQI